ncbi:MAG: GTPase [Planctomycetota bacterium]
MATPPPSARSGAIAVIRVEAPSPETLDVAFRAAAIAPVAVGEAKLRSLAGVDEGVVARPSATHALLMPHAGPAVLTALHTALLSAGWQHQSNPPTTTDPSQRAAGASSRAEPPTDPRIAYPEAEDLIEACTLDAIARASSERAIDVIATQMGHWRAAAPVCDPPTGAALDRLVTPPVVAAIGGANIGKSSVLNALAGTSISIVADEPGTTRDHVGVALTLDGLAVHWLDLPGVRAHPEEIEHRAMQAAIEAARRADLIVLCTDAAEPHEPALEALARWCDDAGLPPDRLHCRLRADLAAHPADPPTLDTSAAAGTGLVPLAEAVRRALVPDAALGAEARWRFHPALPA